MSRLRVALVQLRAFDVDRAADALAHALAAIDDAARSKPHLAVLPEMAYPAYYLGEARPDAFGADAALAAFRERARAHRMALAVGMALPASGGGLVNGAVLIGPDGSVLGRYAKAFLWHFDRRWFAPGDAFPVFDAPFGRLGMLICADGRLPEIARCLALGGAQLLVDLTAWVSWGRTPEDLTSVQREYLMQTRALENGVPVVAADKVGVEQDSIVYCGRSCVIDACGSVVATLGPDEDGVLVHDLDLPDAAAPPVPRRPELYGALVEPTASLPVTAILDEPLVVPKASARIAAVQAEPPEGDALVPFVEHWCRLLAKQDCDLVLFAAPALTGPAAASAGIDAIAALSDRLGVEICVTLRTDDHGVRSRTAYLCSRGEIVLSHRQTHGVGAPDTAVPCPVVETRAGRTGVMIAEEGLVPEVARSLMLRGAETLLWAGRGFAPDPALVARARADENRCALALACPATEDGATLVVSPLGQVLAAALRGRAMACHGQINRALAHWKEMAPGTHVVFGRRPEAYRTLVASSNGPW